MSSFFEAVDLMPTIVEIAMRVAVPQCPRDIPSARATWLCTDGVSVAPALMDKHTLSSRPNACAFSQVPRGKLVDGEPGNVAGEVYVDTRLRLLSCFEFFRVGRHVYPIGMLTYIILGCLQVHGVHAPHRRVEVRV